MLSTVWEKIKAFFAWVYHWITVIVAAVTGFLSAGIDQIDQITGLNLGAVMSEATALKVTFYIALTKIILNAFVKKPAQ